ncbi:iron uptake system protein EfeO [Rothia sp. (in: high G+C Gram-positive bacteria)]|uniref:iron uptake system protein EfeO n=1 Tax=Rothia sp. (in: high G+C Gram-positive bacteria) TaxID=1885016 RepID=UPI000ED23C10|nr:PbrT family lead (Pb2+) uptake porter [Rothia sp. (in: high G+C Gram-positive bacteria)]
MKISTTTTGAALTLAVLALTGCTDNTASNSADGTVRVSSTESECTLSTTEVKAGKNTFSVTNDGSQVTEFYVLAEDGLRILSEVENIGPGITRDLTVNLAEGTYKTSCKPGMVGDGIIGDLTVAANPDESPVSADEQALRDTAITQYTAYIKDQTEQLKTKTDAFADAYATGDDEQARSLYAAARLHYERIEPVAESFGDLDPQLDLREADLEEGQTWTGWHLIEKDLWQPTAEDNGGQAYTPLTESQRKDAATQLKEDTQSLYDQTRDLELTLDQITNGAKSLLDEVAFSKVTGEEEIWSHTDLSDFQGNIDGARVAFEDVRPLLEAKDAELAQTIDGRFNDIQSLLDQHRDNEGFVPYTQLSEDQVRELSDAIDALSEPLSQLTGILV